MNDYCRRILDERRTQPLASLQGRPDYVSRLLYLRPNVDPVDRQRYFAVLDGAKQFVVNVLRCTQDVFGVVRRSTFAARVDPAIVIPPAPVGEVEERLRVQRHQERVEARSGKPG